MASRAKKGVVEILRALWSIGEHAPDVFLKLFDSQILSMGTMQQNHG